MVQGLLQIREQDDQLLPKSYWGASINITTLSRFSKEPRFWRHHTVQLLESCDKILLLIIDDMRQPQDVQTAPPPVYGLYI